MVRHYLTSLRNDRRETQQDVANAVKISRQYYTMIESGERQKRMDITLAARLAQHFGLDVAKIIAMEERWKEETLRDSEMDTAGRL